MIEKLENKKWEVVSSEYLSRELWCTVRVDRVKLPKGNKLKKWYVYEFPNWINVIARTKEGKFLLISQYRHALGVTHYELVAGTCETEEDPMDTAKRELLEETGYGGGEWSEFMISAPNPTNQTNWAYTYLAEGVEKQDVQHLDESEDIKVYLFSLDEMRELLLSGEIIQALFLAPLWRYFALNKLL